MVFTFLNGWKKLKEELHFMTCENCETNFSVHKSSFIETLIYLWIVYGWFCILAAELNSYKRDGNLNIYSLVLYGKWLPTPSLGCSIHSSWPGSAGHGNLDLTNLPKPYFLLFEAITSTSLKCSSPFVPNLTPFPSLPSPKRHLIPTAFKFFFLKFIIALILFI